MNTSVIGFEPFSDLDKVFETNLNFFRPDPSCLGLAVDLYEQGNNLVAEMNIPGIDPAKIDISVEDQNLVVSGQKENEAEIKDKNYYRKEIRRGSFERMIKLPYQVLPNSAKADFNAGVLKITLPKEEKVSNKIKINVAN